MPVSVRDRFDIGGKLEVSIVGFLWNQNFWSCSRDIFLLECALSVERRLGMVVLLGDGGKIHGVILLDKRIVVRVAH